MRDGCPFCDYDGPSIVQWTDGHSIGFEPLNPVTAGHVLIVPKLHIEDFRDPFAVGTIFDGAAFYIADVLRGAPCNVILSFGEAATQTVKHLHVHVVPRRAGDGLMLPWS